MAQQQWTIPGFGGQQYAVGLYHGEESGHLMVHCNGSVLLIDFGVKESKNFSFFLGEELYELKITKAARQYTYQLVHNEEIDSPHNRRRDSEKKTDRWRLISASILAVLFLLGIAIYLWRAPARESDRWAQLAAGEGEHTIAHLTKKNGRWEASYRVEDQIITVNLAPTDTVSPLGFPLNNGDQIPARYLSKSPRMLYLRWREPGGPQLGLYRQLALERHAQEHPELALRQVRCQLVLAESLEGTVGLAKIYQQHVSDFPLYNKNTYLRMIRSQAFRKGVKDCL